jgi:hypothetical protein
MKRLLVIAISLLSLNSNGQIDKDSLVPVKFRSKCLGIDLKIRIPYGYNKPTYENSISGFYIVINYPDKSSIQICCDISSGLEPSDNFKQDVFSKKVTVNGIEFCYYGVPKRRVRLFDKAFELLNGQPNSKDTTHQKVSSTQIDTSKSTSDVFEYDESQDSSPGLLIFALVGLCFMIASVMASIILTVLGLFLLFGFISVGIISTSVLVGLNNKSFSKGFKTFIVLTSSFIGIFICALGFWLLNKVLHWWVWKTAILIGAIFGLLGGLIFGLLTFYILRWLTNYFKTKLNLV